ncbi:dihydrodipicolinate synthase family protein [Bosea caraganae]|uniref:Dihydrodipicolinate synthase family protein n=1 Tax=Bosea caraganae TaxID=2763117 RepID=A0A370L1B4_9HYPH|nr:dihydrodipicolinate synthase family protein [Bosea caraganae]RDJ20632.1 dihydrodipicolinate synthase family protein [Bosea caraganae]RDJ28909.1 dihydrodipicolinate synthase family protein [Bosea caraganae]
MPSEFTWRGIFVIPPTPFHADLSLDLEGLDKVVKFSLDCGAHGIVASANASESAFLSEKERCEVIERTLEPCRGKVPTVVGVSSPCASMAVELARFAAKAGADSVMAMPPTLARPSEGEIRSFYAELAQATDLPIVIQNWAGMGGTPMSAKLVVDLVRDNPTCRFVKEETEFASQMMTDILAVAGGPVEMLGGKSCRFMVDEYRRGACGNMPASELPEMQVKLWDLLEAGDHDVAHDLHAALLPFLTFEIGYGAHMFKSVLQRRGIIASNATRQTGGRRLDERGVAYLDHLLRKLSGLMHPLYPLPA